MPSSRRIRKCIEEAFGWIKTIAGQEKTKLRDRDRVGWALPFAAAAYNLVRLREPRLGPLRHSLRAEPVRQCLRAQSGQHSTFLRGAINYGLMTNVVSMISAGQTCNAHSGGQRWKHTRFDTG